MSDPAAAQIPAPRIETERLVLRAFEPDDERYVTFYTDADVMRYIPRGPWNAEDIPSRFGRMLDFARERWRTNGFGMWAVEIKETGAVIGHCGLQRLENSDEIEVYYLFDKPHWNKGIATEATVAALRFADGLGLKNIVAVAYPDNRASQRVMEKCGLIHVGHAHHYGLELVKYELTSTRERKADSKRAGGNPGA